MITALILTGLCILANIGDKKMLLLSLMVCGSYFLPVHLITDRDLWYIVCLSAELTVLASAVLLRVPAIIAIVPIIFMMSAAHIIDYLAGSKVSSPYRIVLHYLEYVEIACCLIFSHPILNNLKEYVKCYRLKH